MSDLLYPATERRSFLTGLKAGVASLAALTLGASSAEAKSAQKRWEPARHEKDDWFDKVPTKHRLVFDTVSADSFADALAFAGNYIRTNKTEYGVEESELAVVIIARHRSTPFAYNDAMWAKYGEPMSKQINFTDPKTKGVPAVNVFNNAEAGQSMGNRGTTIDSLTKQGLRLGVCSTATRAFAGGIAKAVGKKQDEIVEELIHNLAGDARMVPAGIVAVSRAQERGYTVVKG